jgi:hypothetical protein
MTRRRDDKQAEPEGGRAADRLRDFLRRRSIEDEEQPPRAAVDEKPDAEGDTAEDDRGR